MFEGDPALCCEFTRQFGMKSATAGDGNGVSTSCGDGTSAWAWLLVTNSSNLGLPRCQVYVGQRMMIPPQIS